MIFRFAVMALLGLAGCDTTVTTKEDPLAKNVIDDAGFNSLLLTAGDPNQAVRYFEGALAEEPDRADFRRGLAISYRRARRFPEAARVYQELVSLNQATPSDRLDYAFVSVSLDRWEDASALEAALPAALNTSRRHLLTALIADHDGRWEEADAAYERAVQLSDNPAKVYNNWGVSKMARNEHGDAQLLFEQALAFDSRVFSAKNNLAMSRALQGDYSLPVVPMTDREKAMVLNNLGIIAANKNEMRIARGLFAAAVETHPQHYESAANRLAALEATVEN